MSRSEAVRQEALELDGFRCQVCGLDGRDLEQGGLLQVHHVVSLGMGGSDELDVVENTITLCGDCHAEIHAASRKIVRWNRGAGEFEVLDIEQRKIPHERLWFHRRKLAAVLEPIEARISGLHMIDGDVAKDVYTLARDDAWKVLDTDSRSFREYAASRSWDARKASRLASLWAKGLEREVEWEPGMTEADFRRKLRAVVGGEERAYFYLRVPNHQRPGDGSTAWYRSSDEGGLRDEMKPGDVLVKVGKCIYGVRAEGGKLFGPDGAEIEVVSACSVA